MPEGSVIPKYKCDLCRNDVYVHEREHVLIGIGIKTRISKELCPQCANDLKTLFERFLDGKKMYSMEKGTMLSHEEDTKKCPFCNWNVKFYIADTPAVKRTYCPHCLADIEVVWKERK